MSLNKNKNKDYIGFEDIIENQEHSKNFVDIFKQVKLRKSAQRKDKRVKDLSQTALFKYAKLYEKNNGSGYSVLEEVLTNFNISRQYKHLTDLVTYVATKEFDDITLKKFNKFLKDCSHCIKDIQEQELLERKSAKSNRR